MADVTPQKRELPARERRESAAKRMASSPAQPSSTTSTPAARKPSAGTSTPTTGRKTGYTRGPYKKRASLIQIQTPTSASRSSPSVSVSGDLLPTRIIADKPLPTSRQKQSPDLSLKEYQSVAESAILAASLLQSRMRWLYHGVFDKYWVKPAKRKGFEPPLNNPDVKSMARLGNATITIEPHTFDVTFYVVRDTTIPPPYQRHPNQHTTKQMGPPSHPVQQTAYPPYPSYQQPRPSPVPPPAQPAPALNPSSNSKSATPAQSVNVQSLANTPHNGPPTDPLKQESTSQPSYSAPPPAQTPPAPPTPLEPPAQTQQASPKPNPPAAAPPKGSTQDPVIQMLAARAAADPQLKELMKIVATSRASPEQLKEFQSHIDEFHEMIRRQEAERLAKSEKSTPEQPPTTQTPTSTSQPPANHTAPSTPIGSDAAISTLQPAKSLANTPVQPPAPVTAQTQPRQQPLPAPGALPGVMHTVPKPTPPATRVAAMAGYAGYPLSASPRPEPLIKHVVMEFTSVPSGSISACPDRWLFPEHAVLEMRPNGLDMVCSFLVERKGSQILSASSVEIAADTGKLQGSWKADQDYYQPVTMTIQSRDHKIVQTIAKAAKTLPAVQEYMKEVMSKKQRAPAEYLVHQLPRNRSHTADSTETEFVDSGVELNSGSASEDDELQEYYGF